MSKLILRSGEHWEDPNTFEPKRFLDRENQCLPPKYWIPFEIGARACPGKSFAMDVLFTLGLKIVTELQLSFDGFVEREVAFDENELKFFGMVFVHVHSFEMAVKKLTVSVEDNPNIQGLRCQQRRKSVLLELGEHKEWQDATENDAQHGL